MQAIRQTFHVAHRYTVHFTDGIFQRSNPTLAAALERDDGAAPRKLLCVVDQGVHDHHPGLPQQVEAYCRANPDLTLACPPIVLPGGEAVKNDVRFVEQLQEVVSQYGLCRHSYLVAVGGGALLDMAGYAAATAHRGIRLVRVPTTVLSQNDSGMGVKNGINAFGKKNFLGVFAPPYAVINDSSFLATLSHRDWIAGIAEAVKVALIKDAAFFDFIEEHAGALVRRESEPMRRLIYRCAELHLNHISSAGDPFETGCSRPLDFGHWAAHKLEQMSRFRLRHGEAVAIGIALDSSYSRRIGLLDEAQWRRIVDLLSALGFALHVPELSGPLSRFDSASLLHGLTEFREHLGGPLTLILLAGIGKSVDVHHVEDDIIQESISDLAAVARRAGGVPLERSISV